MKTELEHQTMFDKMMLESISQESEESYELVSLITENYKENLTAEQLYEHVRSQIISKYKNQLKEEEESSDDN